MMINAVMENSETLEIYPGVMMTSLFKTMSAKELFDLINAKDYIYKNKWKFYYFELIPEEMVDEYIFNELITYLKDDSDKDIKSSSWRKLRFLDKFVIFDKDIYITASKIIFAKREYSRFIVEMYFTLLFDEYWYTPKEVLEIYNDNLKLLRDIYFFMLCNDNMVDLKGTFLLYFLHIEKEWIDDFANHVADNINSERDHDNYRYMALWRADEYLEYYDCIFKKLANSETYISEWRLTNLFKSILFYGNKDELIKNRQEAWIMHIIEENAMSDSVIIIFEALSEADIVLRKKALLLFLSINDDYELFKKIPLDPSHWEGNAGEIVFQLTKRIDFLESLISELKGVKYLRHVKRIRDRIEMYKFRSMYMDAEERRAELMAQNKMSDGRMFKIDFDPRVIGNKILPDGTRKTGIGEFIRKTSLDEFPQFWNVLNGTMSLVGTRPILQDELQKYELHHRARIAIKPGITGMWQVSGRSDITDFEEVVRLDTEYISNWNFGLDIKILLKTVMTVLKREGSV